MLAAINRKFQKAFTWVTIHFFVFATIGASAGSLNSCGIVDKRKTYNRILENSSSPTSIDSPFFISGEVDQGDQQGLDENSNESDYDDLDGSIIYDRDGKVVSLTITSCSGVSVPESGHGKSEAGSARLPSSPSGIGGRNSGNSVVAINYGKKSYSATELREATSKHELKLNSNANDLRLRIGRSSPNLVDPNLMATRHNDTIRNALPEPSSKSEPLFKANFRTAEGTEAGEKVRDVAAAINYAEKRVEENNDGYKNARVGLLDIAKLQTAGADHAFAEGNKNSGDRLLYGALTSIDLALSFVPIAGVANDLLSLSRGKSLNGDVLSDLDKGLILAGLLAPAFIVGGAKLFRHARAGEAVAGAIGKSLVQKYIGDVIKNAPIDELTRGIEAAAKLGAKNAGDVKTFLAIEGVLQKLPARLAPKRIRFGSDGTKLAVIGRKMDGHVNDAHAILNAGGVQAEKFMPSGPAQDAWDTLTRDRKRLDEATLKSTLMYTENIDWIEQMINEGYTIIDIGFPSGVLDPSHFYSMECLKVFGGHLE